MKTALSSFRVGEKLSRPVSCLNMSRHKTRVLRVCARLRINTVGELVRKYKDLSNQRSVGRGILSVVRKSLAREGLDFD